MKIPFDKFPVIETERLKLDALLIDDLIELYTIRSNRLINQYTGITLANTTTDIEHYLFKMRQGYMAGNLIIWGIRLATHSKLIGTICLWNFSEDKLNAEIGFVLLPAFSGNGYMTEAAQTIETFAKNRLSFNQMNAICHEDNTPAITLLKSLKYTIESCTTKDPNTILFSKFL